MHSWLSARSHSDHGSHSDHSSTVPVLGTKNWGLSNPWSLLPLTQLTAYSKLPFPHDSLGVCFVCVCVFVYVRRYAIQVYSHVCTWKLSWHPVSSLITLHFIYWGSISCWTWNSPIPACLASCLPLAVLSLSPESWEVQWPLWPRGFYVGSNH